MASSSNNITAVHYSLIFFVVLWLLTGVVAYLQYTDVKRLEATSRENDQAARDRKAELDSIAEGTRVFKDKAGYPEKLGYGEGDQDTALGKLRADLEKFGDDAQTLREALFRKMVELNREKTLRTTNEKNLQAEIAQLKQSKNAAEKAINNQPDPQMGNLTQQQRTQKVDELKTELGAVLNKLNDPAFVGDEWRMVNALDLVVNVLLGKDLPNDPTRQKGLIALLDEERKRVEQIEKEKEEAIAAKQKTIDDLQTANRKLIADIDQLKISHQEAIAKLDKQIQDLQSTVALKQQQIDELQKVSFERPDGKIRWVDHGTGLVWIDIGKEDRLPDNMTFSVYTQAHHGIARGRKDIKGSIEITRVVGPRLAEARILKNDLYKPIRAGDPIYTPLWSAGVKESFAFAGVFDLDEDGDSDRGLLHRIVRAAGATISNEVDDQGVRHGTGLTNEDKFLVLGHIPDPLATADPKEREIREKMAKELKQIEDEAKNKGVRIIRKSDFLAYIGFKADRRLWRPGESPKRLLKAGAQSTTTNQTVGRRQPSGQVSGIYTRRGRVRGARSSSGQASKIFGGKGR